MKHQEIIEEIKEIRDLLEKIKPIHIDSKSKVNISTLNVDLALYILGGKIISLTYTALSLIESTKVSDIGPIIRLIYESAFLSEHFYDKGNSKSINKWFQNKVIAPRKTRQTVKQYFLKMFGKYNEDFNNAIDTLYSELSKYVHPTYAISKLNLNVKTMVFDYEWEEFKKYDIPIPISISSATIVLINTIRFCKKFYDIDKTLDDNLQEIIKKLEKLNI